MSKEAMRLALEALEYIEHNYMSLPAPAEKAITALREALAEQPAQQALNKMAQNAREIGLDYEPAQQKRWAVFCQGCRKEWTVSYPHPGKSICADCDDKLAEQPAQQEPVAYLVDGDLYYPEEIDWETLQEQIPTNDQYGGALWTPLYTTPPPVTEPHKRPSRSDIKPLSDEEIILIVADCASSHQHTDIHFARAIEAKLKEKNGL